MAGVKSDREAFEDGDSPRERRYGFARERRYGRHEPDPTEAPPWEDGGSRPHRTSPAEQQELAAQAMAEDTYYD